MIKLRILVYGYFIILAIILVKLFIIQILASEKYVGNNYLRTKKITPARGNIYDRNNQPLVFNQTTYKLYLEPHVIQKKETVKRQLDEILSLGEATLEAKLESSKRWVSVTAGVTQQNKEKIEKLQIKGLGFEEESRRFYPEASLAAHLLGFVGKNEDGDDLGYFGLEGYYERDLAGLPGILRTERDLFGNPIFIGVQNKVEADDGRNLILSVDKTVQFIAKEKLKNGMERYLAKEGCVIVANPQTMEILALTCLPDFDPTEYQKFSAATFKNPVVSSIYEPGSIFKPLIMAAAINERVVKPSDSYDEAGSVKISGYEIQTWDNKYEGEITMTRILEKSSNVGMVYVGEKLGKDNLLKYYKRYGIGEKTGIDIQGEVSGFLKPESQWRPIDYATSTFGQGIVVTPVQMLRSFSAIINGGELLRPYIVMEIRSGKESKKVTKKTVRKVLDKRTSILMKSMLKKTVEHAEAKWDRPKGFSIGGKTGTAQVPIGGRYDPTKTIASFIGFAPVEEPKFLIMVIFKEPQTSPWGSETAAPVFFEIVKELLVYYNIAPE